MSKITHEIKWHPAPVKVSFGDGMMITDVELDKDSTVTMYCHEDDIDKVMKLLKD